MEAEIQLSRVFQKKQNNTPAIELYTPKMHNYYF